MALSLPPLQQKRMGSGEVKKVSKKYESCQEGAQHAAPLHRKMLIAAGAAIVEAEAKIAAEGGKADRFLILFVEKIGDAAVERKAAGEIVGGGEIETGIAGIASDAEAIEIAIGADTGEIAGQVEVEAMKAGVQPEISGVHGTAKEMIAGLLDGRSGGDGFEHASVVVRIVSLEQKPVIDVGFA